MTSGRWIGVAIAVAAALAWGGCSKARKTASARPAERRQAAPARPQVPPSQPPLVVAIPERDEPAGHDAEAVRRRLIAQAEGPPELVDGPWAGAVPGQFVTYRGADGVSLTHKVVAVGPDAVTVETSTSLGAGRTIRHPIRVPAGRRFGAVPATAQWAWQEIDVAGHRLPCRVATWMAGSSLRQRFHRVWLCDRIPGRLVRSERGDGRGRMEVVLELVRFGR